MANEIRQRRVGIGGLVEDAGMTATSQLLTSAGLAGIAGGVDSAHHMAIVIGPDGDLFPPEVAYIVSLTAGAGATGATGLLRAQEGSTGQAWPQGTPWIHTTTLRDMHRQVQKIDTSGTNATTTATTLGDVDATNLPALSISGYVGDIFEWAFTGTFSQSASGNPVYFDALITLPDATTTTFRAQGSHSEVHVEEFASNGTDCQTRTIRGLYVATQNGIHQFKPQWKVGSGTGTLIRAGTLATPPYHLIKNLGAPAD